jgi:carbamoyltransferase
VSSVFRAGPINKVKGREIWRPLAPSVLNEFANDYFENPKVGLGQFMFGAFKVKESKWSEIPATVHIDGSARPLFVTKEANIRYWRLIDAYRKITNVPVILNTSFNLASEPIVHTPTDAINSFLQSDIDILVLEDYLILKSNTESKPKKRTILRRK